ncbi:hypothetical protein [Vibrio mangrovi]|uniref:Uncharacterized protein n=1 Tax=Vibrio mangrovi TaxID=474394 RepID=A0A1Y6IUQ8_9VIBR|nr:hypothetical protein [Vibrio mangrovi]MDW6004449.1 hypothetical protein [Vibrio mangrovi]MDW6004463.1 hypothetical protein [Vibrio mangrovi]SMS00751.1 hypothetical protein VIM7927_02020 [Vibrio mangrovi]
MYKKQFIDAFNITKSLGFETDSIDLNGALLDQNTRAKIYSTIQNQLGKFSPEEVSQQCFGATYILKNELEQLLDKKFYYTLGYIDLEGKSVFYTDFDVLKGYMGQQNKTFSQPINLHAWLTTTGGEIIDATLMTTLSVVRKQPELLGGVIASVNESLTDLSYHPQIIGEEYLKDCGFMVDFEFWEFS